RSSVTPAHSPRGRSQHVLALSVVSSYPSFATIPRSSSGQGVAGHSVTRSTRPRNSLDSVPRSCLAGAFCWSFRPRESLAGYPRRFSRSHRQVCPSVQLDNLIDRRDCGWDAEFAQESMKDLKSPDKSGLRRSCLYTAENGEQTAGGSGERGTLSRGVGSCCSAQRADSEADRRRGEGQPTD